MSAGSVDGPDSVEERSNELGEAPEIASAEVGVGQPLGKDPSPARRRTWPQRLLIAGSLFVGVGLLVAAGRLNAFEETVGSIVRIDVPAGVLADLEVPIAEEGNGGTPAESVDMGSSDKERPSPPRNLLLIGTDSAVGLPEDDPAGKRDRTPGVALADAIMLLRLDPQLGTASLLSLPRDLYVMIHREGVPVREEKLASALLVGGMELGAPTLVETVTRNFGVPIHNFAVVDFLGFEEVVDEIGGVPVWFPYPTRDVASGLYVSEAGCTVLDGRAGLAFVRSRKLELFVEGRWQRVGLWNDLERNQRQQDFLILAMEQVVNAGARSIIVRDDLIQAAARSVVLDDRLTIRTLLSLGNTFAGFDPDELDRHVLPVYDDVVGSSSVLRLRPESRRVFDVFRGIALRPEDVSVLLVDARGPVEESVPAHAQLVLKGFPVETAIAEALDITEVRAHREDFAAAVLVGQMVTPTPKFRFTEDPAAAARPVELVLGRDFASFLLVPRAHHEVDALARLAVSDPEAFGEVGAPALSALPTRSAARLGMEVPLNVDGRRPDGSSCS
ncbi:MAG TPA: hypothetical protein DGF10_07765 [Acidimicrobiaceae bacterium]|nr:hypothetical protein [Acidimicrobiaceae bacterium]HCV34551.1 hypothetical protein [Acidimicrobiaceae bacterium]